MVAKFLFQFCEYYPDYESCKTWIAKNLPDKFASLGLGDGEDDRDADEAKDGEGKKRQTRGGKGKVSRSKVTYLRVSFMIDILVR